VPLERAPGPVIDDGPAFPEEARPLLRRARHASQRLVHDEIGTWEERAFLPDDDVHVHHSVPIYPDSSLTFHQNEWKLMHDGPYKDVSPFICQTP
jgi:hypothetical protein